MKLPHFGCRCVIQSPSKNPAALVGCRGRPLPVKLRGQSGVACKFHVGLLVGLELRGQKLQGGERGGGGVDVGGPHHPGRLDAEGQETGLSDHLHAGSHIKVGQFQDGRVDLRQDGGKLGVGASRKQERKGVPVLGVRAGGGLPEGQDGQGQSKGLVALTQGAQQHRNPGSGALCGRPSQGSVSLLLDGEKWHG